ncbi:MAG: PAS domain S-box protein [Dehalococcoidales bacterium]|nr:PAS domain S-box protein [Dehalococcoidales bacterium]
MRLHRDGYFWMIVFFIVVTLLLTYGVESYLLDEGLKEQWHLTLVLMRDILLVMAVTVAGLRFGFRAGLGTWLASGLILAPHIIIEAVVWSEGIAAVVHSAMLGAIALPLLWLASYQRRVTMALRKSEENFRRSLDDSPLGIRIVNEDGETIYANQAMLDIYGYNIEELKTAPTQKRYTPQSYAEHHLRREGRERGEHVPSSYEISIVRKDGEIRHLEVFRKEVLWNGQTEFQVLYNDVTERKRAEEALRNSEHYYRSLIHQMHEDIVVIDREYIITDINNNFMVTSGMPREQVIGRHCYEVTHKVDIPCDQIGEQCSLKEVFRDGQPRNCQHTHLKADGSEVVVDILLSPLKNTEGSITHIVEAMRDITELKQAEEQIRQTAREWQVAFDSIPDWVSIHDRDFKIVRANKALADAIKMNPEEIIGRYCFEVIHGEKEANQYCAHAQALETGKPSRREFFNPHLGIYMEMLCSPIFNDNGEISTTVHIGRDITERKKMEAQMMITDRLASIGELASGIAHELVNPLTGVIGFSDLLMGKKDLPEDIREDLSVIKREALRATQVARNLLIFARRHPDEKLPTDINKAIQPVLELRAYEQRVSNIEVITRLAADLPPVLANEFQLQQVFINIILNAEFFMIESRGRGTLTIETEQYGKAVRASFADDGPGIAPEHLTHIFDPFYTTKEVGKGTGLGLSICYGTITEHGGRIWAESELGKGATFIIELPVHEEK